MPNNEFYNRIAINSNVSSGLLLQKFATEILNAKNRLSDPCLDVYRLDDGTIIEFHRNGTFHPQETFSKGNTVLSFPVNNIDESVTKMLAAGAKTLDGIIRLSANYAYCYLILGDDLIIGLHQKDNLCPFRQRPSRNNRLSE